MDSTHLIYQTGSFCTFANTDRVLEPDTIFAGEHLIRKNTKSIVITPGEFLGEQHSSDLRCQSGLKIKIRGLSGMLDWILKFDTVALRYIVKLML